MELVNSLIIRLLAGGPELTAVLLLFIVLMLLDRKRLIKRMEALDVKLDRVIENHHDSRSTVAKAMNSLNSMINDLEVRFEKRKDTK